MGASKEPSMVPEIDQPVYERALDLIVEGYVVALVPVETVDGDTGVFLQAIPMGQNAMLEKNSLSPSKGRRTAAIIFACMDAHKKLPSGYWPA